MRMSAIVSSFSSGSKSGFQLQAVTPAYSGLKASFLARVDVSVTTSGGTGVLPKAFGYHP